MEEFGLFNSHILILNRKDLIELINDIATDFSSLGNDIYRWKMYQ